METRLYLHDYAFYLRSAPLETKPGSSRRPAGLATPWVHGDLNDGAAVEIKEYELGRPGRLTVTGARPRDRPLVTPAREEMKHSWGFPEHHDG
jgi:hypothetical protein